MFSLPAVVEIAFTKPVPTESHLPGMVHGFSTFLEIGELYDVVALVTRQKFFSDWLRACFAIECGKTCNRYSGVFCLRKVSYG